MADVLGGKDWDIVVGDAFAALRGLPDGVFHTAVTSPPYFALRDYQTGTWEGGDVPGCDHKQPGRTPSTWETCGLQRNKKTPELSAGTVAVNNHAQEANYRDVCGKCGARRVDAQLGLERRPYCPAALFPEVGAPCGACYVCRLVAVFREVRRTLRDDGTCWVVIADSYASGEVGRHDGYNFGDSDKMPTARNDQRKRFKATTGTKPKDLLLVPHALALALRADGWYLRSEIVWHKKSPMPESVRDRPTRAHEQVFLLAKSRSYFFDMEAVKERAVRPGDVQRFGKRLKQAGDFERGDPQFRNGHEQWGREVRTGDNGRSLRSVWHLGPEAYRGSHFAVFPTALVRTCLLAATSERGVCPSCGMPWRRVVERQTVRDLIGNQALAGGKNESLMRLGNYNRKLSFSNSHDQPQCPHVCTVGWHPSCLCYGVPLIPPPPDKDDPADVWAAWRAERDRLLKLSAPLPASPALVLDPFVGSGTTLVVCRRLGRRGLGIDLSEKYAQMARRRVESALRQTRARPGANGSPGLFDGLEEGNDRVD